MLTRKLITIFFVLILGLSACSTAARPTATSIPLPTTDTAPLPTATPIPLPPTDTATMPTPWPTYTPLPTSAIPTVIPMTPTPVVLSVEEIKADVDARLQELTNWGSFNGSVLVARGGQVILSSGYGFADRDKKTPNTPQTKFIIGWVTRGFTAMGIMILQERGKLNVQDKLCQYLKDCPSAWQPVTLHQMLTDTSGIPNPPEASYTTTLTSTLPLIAEVKSMPLDFSPGSSYGWSGTDYYLLGQVIEIVSGQSYEDFLQANIFTPLQMSDTGLAHNLDGMAIGYNDKSTPADRPILFAGDSDSGLYSTVEDLYRWDQALYSEKLVSQKSLDAIFTAYILSPMIGPGTQYSYGWIVYTFGKQNWFAIPSFMTPGYQTDIDRQLNDKITIIILSNQWDVGAHDIVERIQAIGFGQ